MGTWGAGSFQNDWALDWVYDVCQSADIAIVYTALKAVNELRKPPQPSFIGRWLGARPIEPYLEAYVACEAFAAAEIVAFWLGHPAKHFPEELGEWATRHAGSFTPEMVALARKAVTTVKAKSNLKDSWEEGDGPVALDWYDAIADLEWRLQEPNP